MKRTILTLAALLLASPTFVHAAEPLPPMLRLPPNGLAISAEASLLAGTSAPQLFLTVHLRNTTNHEMVVLTKNLDSDIDFNPADATKWTCTLGYNQPGVTYQGRLIVPPLNDFSPVTIKPNEEAVITHRVKRNRSLKLITKDAQLTVCYAISPNWGSRFATWSGSVTSKPFKTSVIP